MTTSIRLAPKADQRLDFLALHTGRPKAFYLRELVERGLEIWKTTTSQRTYWNASAKARKEPTPPRMQEQPLAWAIEYTDTAKTRLRKLDRKTERKSCSRRPARSKYFRLYPRAVPEAGRPTGQIPRHGK